MAHSTRTICVRSHSEWTLSNPILRSIQSKAIDEQCIIHHCHIYIYMMNKYYIEILRKIKIALIFSSNSPLSIHSSLSARRIQPIHSIRQFAQTIGPQILLNVTSSSRNHFLWFGAKSLSHSIHVKHVYTSYIIELWLPSIMCCACAALRLSLNPVMMKASYVITLTNGIDWKKVARMRLVESCREVEVK